MRGTREFEKKKDGGFFIMSTEKYLAFDALAPKGDSTFPSNFSPF